MVFMFVIKGEICCDIFLWWPAATGRAAVMVMMFVEVERGGGEFVSSRVKSKSWYVSTVGIKFYGGHRYSEERCRGAYNLRNWYFKEKVGSSSSGAQNPGKLGKKGVNALQRATKQTTKAFRSSSLRYRWPMQCYFYDIIIICIHSSGTYFHIMRHHHFGLGASSLWKHTHLLISPPPSMTRDIIIL